MVVVTNAIDAIRLILRLGANRSIKVIPLQLIAKRLTAPFVQNNQGQTAAGLAQALGHKKLQKAIESFRETPVELLKPTQGPWVWLPFVLPVLLNGSVFFSLILAPRWYVLS